MSTDLKRTELKSTHLRSNFTKDADVAFDDFCKQFLNSSNGIFISPDFSQTELNNNIKSLNTKQFTNPNQVTRTIPVKNIKEVTELDLEKKSIPITITSSSQLLKQHKHELINARSNLREKIIESIRSNKYSTFNNLIRPLDESNIKCIKETNLADKSRPNPVKELCKNQPEVKFNDTLCNTKLNNATIHAMPPKHRETNENYIESNITNIFNNPKAEFVLQPSKLEKGSNTNYHGSMSIQDFKNKLKSFDAYNEIQSNKNCENIQYKSQYTLGKDNNKINFYSSSVNQRTNLIQNQNQKILESKKINDYPPHLSASTKNGPALRSVNQMSESHVFLTKEFNHFLNEYLSTSESKRLVKAPNLRVSSYYLKKHR